MAFPTAVNEAIKNEVVKEVMSGAGLAEDGARKVVETVINLLASKEVLLKEDTSSPKKA